MPYLLIILFALLPLTVIAVPHDTLWVALRSGDTVLAQRINFNWNTIRGGKVKIKLLNGEKVHYFFNEVVAMQDRREKYKMHAIENPTKNRHYILSIIQAEGHFNFYYAWNDNVRPGQWIEWAEESLPVNRYHFRNTIRPMLKQCLELVEHFGERRIKYMRVRKLFRYYNAHCAG